MPNNPMAGGNVIAEPRTPNQPVVAAFPEQGPAVLPGYVRPCPLDEERYPIAKQVLAVIFDERLYSYEQIEILVTASEILGIDISTARAAYYAASQIRLTGFVNDLRNLLAARTQDASVREQASNPVGGARQNLSGMFEESVRNSKRKATQELAKQLVKRVALNDAAGGPVCGCSGGPRR